MRARFPQNWIFRACAPAQSSLKIGGTPAETEVNVSKKIKLFGVLLSFVLCFALLIGCGPSENGGNGGNQQQELQPGTITFEDGDCEIIRGVADSGKLDLATASNGAVVSYAMSEEETAKFNKAFDNALTLSTDGTIKGTASRVTGVKCEVTASAEKCDPVTAEVTFEVIFPYLTFEGGVLTDARQGVAYAGTVAAFLTEADAGAEFEITEGELPAGLEMDEYGTITGTPTATDRGKTFTVTASARNYTETSAEFTLSVIINNVSEAKGEIINFGGDEPTTLENVYKGSYYANQKGVAGNAASTNSNYITYALAAGSELPEGITLYPNGALIGSVDPDMSPEDIEFDVVASAEGCADVTATFVLPVKNARIVFPTVNGQLTRGEAANYNIAPAAELNPGIDDITFSMEEDDAAKLKSEYGLEVTSAGLVTGTPKKSVKSMNFEVTASSADSTATTASIFFRIVEPLQAAEDNKFEAEYTDLDGKQGTGYSGSPTGESLIARGENLNISEDLYVSYLHNTGITLEFVIYAAEDTDAPLYLSLGSELRTITLTPSAFGIVVYNGTQTPSGSGNELQYGSVTVTGGGASWTYAAFAEYSFGTVHLTEGYNVIQLQIRANTLRDGSTGGPGVDYLRLDTSTALTWSPCLYNLDLISV